jgi:hypothetical protein
MTTIVKLRNSVTATNAPISLEQGEVAINITYKKVWVGNAAGTPIQLLGTGANGSFTDLAYSGTLTGGTGIVNLGSGQFYKEVGGNIGIGTTTPSYKLHVIGTVDGGEVWSASQNLSTVAGSSAGFVGIVDGTTNYFTLTNNTTSSQTILNGFGAGGISLNAFASAPIIFKTNNNERMRIANDGNVAIGNTGYANSGVIALDVSVQAGFAGSSNSTYLSNNLYFTSGTTVAYKVSGYGANLYEQNRQLEAHIWYNAPSGTAGTTATLSEKMRITSAGYLGIGTSAPTRLLDVRQAYTTDTIVAQIGNTNNGNGSTPVATIFDFTENNGTSVGRISSIYTQSLGTTDLAFGNYGSGSLTEQMRITSAGLLKFNSGYGSVATAYGCRAWVNFDGNTNNDISGTYTQTGTTVTVTITAHGYTTGQVAYLDFTSGTAVDGSYTVTVTDANVFTVTQASRTTIGNVTSKRKTIRASGNVSSVADNATGDYTINFTTAMPDANYSVNATLDNGSTGAGAVINIDRDASSTPLTTQTVRFQCVNTADTPTALDSEFVCVTIFR